MKIIVTGGAGFIGSNFVHHMVNKYPEYQIINLDLLTYAGNLENLKPVEDKSNYRFVRGDIADRAFIFDLFEKEKPDMVVNFAAESHVDRSITDPEAFVRTNVMGTTTLLDACRTYGAIIRCLRMRCTGIFPLTARISSLRRRRLFTPPAPILPRKPARIFLSWLTTGPMGCR